jgi:DNA polymerase-3 subunit gamma/tau
VLGITGLENAYRCALAVKERNFEALFSAVADVVASSKDVMVFWQELVSFWRDMLVAKSTRNVADYLDLTAPDFELLRDAAAKFTTAELVYHSSLLDDALVNMQKIPQNKRNFAEITLVKLASPELLVNTDALLARLSTLEDKIKLLGTAPIAARPVVAESVSTEVKAEPAAEENPKVEKITDNTAAAPQTTPKKSVGADGMREVTDKSEIIERVKVSIPMIAGFLTSSRILVSTDRRHVTVQVGNPMAQMMLTKTESMQALTEAFILSGAADSGCEIKVETAEIKEEEKSPLDELDIF